MRYDSTSGHTIEATGLVKRFGKTTALDGVDLVARQGRVLGVLGPNGPARRPRCASWPRCSGRTTARPPSAATTCSATHTRSGS